MQRVGLYIMVFIILAFGPCKMQCDHNDILEKLERIETQLGIVIE